MLELLQVWRNADDSSFQICNNVCGRDQQVLDKQEVSFAAIFLKTFGSFFLFWATTTVVVAR